MPKRTFTSDTSAVDTRVLSGSLTQVSSHHHLKQCCGSFSTYKASAPKLLCHTASSAQLSGALCAGG